MTGKCKDIYKILCDVFYDYNKQIGAQLVAHTLLFRDFPRSTILWDILMI